MIRGRTVFRSQGKFPEFTKNRITTEGGYVCEQIITVNNGNNSVGKGCKQQCEIGRERVTGQVGDHQQITF